MLGQDENVGDFENDFLKSGLGKLVDEKTTKKAATETVVEVKEENEVVTEKAKLFLRILKPIGYLVVAGVVIRTTIKNISVEKFIRFAENFIKLMLF
ncbi:MAG: hypothetical protein PF513_03215 [Tenericutes bacterium]|jgi:hypothetical protein|nr:hypothetical protein [Mycoplasmatota bacterium]